MTDDGEFAVVDARHPVVERVASEPFVPNDLSLNGTTRQLVILTGPNMGGKSTYLRQSALLSVLAQIGSFVPAKQARLPIVDRVFARVGASDNIARGYSTFMVEMRETARILHTATSKSLVVLDEIGRGTATFDGMSIAWAVAEYLVTNPAARPRTLFATHYHELTDLADARPGVANAHVLVREWHDDILFLRKVVDGRSDRSYGIQVARLAGLPADVVTRAREILIGARAGRAGARRPAVAVGRGQARRAARACSARPSPVDDELTRRLAGLDVDRLTPIDALTTLAGLVKDAKARLCLAPAGTRGPIADLSLLRPTRRVSTDVRRRLRQRVGQQRRDRLPGCRRAPSARLRPGAGGPGRSRVRPPRSARRPPRTAATTASP